MTTPTTPTKPVKLYLAGPMSGLPDNNYPEFNRVAALLRAKGYEVLNPAENPEPPCKSWSGYMRMSYAQILECQGVVFLRDWLDSKGAQLENKVAHSLNLKRYQLQKNNTLKDFDLLKFRDYM